MIEIGANETETGVFQKDISKDQDISLKYLDHIINALKTANLIANVKGKKSGYALTRDPRKISILDIHNAFEHGVCVVDCLDQAVSCEREKYCQVQGFWGDINKLVRDYLESVTLHDLILREKQVVLDT